jgi:potassium-transporting ATPase KdpC subunit
MFLKATRTAIVSIFLFSVLTGLFYPALVTGIAQLMFPGKANGSIVMRDRKAMGSELIGQAFSSSKYFWSRPSATSPFAYNAEASSGSNLGPSNPVLLEAIQKRVKALKGAALNTVDPVPVDLVTASGSGLDPHISVAAALYQIPRVARSRQLNETDLRSFVDRYTEWRQLGFLGEPRVNILKLNLALDDINSAEETKR